MPGTTWEQALFRSIHTGVTEGERPREDGNQDGRTSCGCLGQQELEEVREASPYSLCREKRATMAFLFQKPFLQRCEGMGVFVEAMRC